MSLEIFEQVESLTHGKCSVVDYLASSCRRILTYWARLGCPVSESLLGNINEYSQLMQAFSNVSPMNRLFLQQGSILNPFKIVGSIKTSGSSGIPLRYYVSTSWRNMHAATWKSAYQWMSHGEIEDYLDKRLVWAMARVPGGRLDQFSNVIECTPKLEGVQLTGPNVSCPDVVHGSINTMIEMLEMDVCRAWSPKYVIFTYEKPLPFQMNIVSRFWPGAQLHQEYCSNDGGATGFTCPLGNLHFWPTRALPLQRDGALRVIDLWNEAMSFVAYENGDEVTWHSEACPCGLPFSMFEVEGRQGSIAVLENGAKISHICPLSSTEMEGIRALKIYIEDGDIANFKYIPDPGFSVDKSSIEQTLNAMGFAATKFSEVRQFGELRSMGGKFRTFIDTRKG